jgi:hypothetical protein
MMLFSTSTIGVQPPAPYTGYSGSSADSEARASDTNTKAEAAEEKPAAAQPVNGQTDELALAEILEIERLKQRDREVTAHEMAHIAAGGPYVRGGATFQYQYGPDGKRYAVGGEVSIDMATISGDPEATISKMRTVIGAALAPASPSAQDRMVAARASRIQMDMQMERIQLKMTQAKAEYQKTANASSPVSFSAIKSKNTAAGTGSMVDLIG